jgi:hypothetical protein
MILNMVDYPHQYKTENRTDFRGFFLKTKKNPQKLVLLALQIYHL